LCILLVSKSRPAIKQNLVFKNFFCQVLFGFSGMLHFNPPFGILKILVPKVSNNGWGPILVQVVAMELRFVVPHDNWCRSLATATTSSSATPIAESTPSQRLMKIEQCHRQNMVQVLVHPRNPNTLSLSYPQDQQLLATATPNGTQCKWPPWRQCLSQQYQPTTRRLPILPK
jgi:hypothetical protein